MRQAESSLKIRSEVLSHNELPCMRHKRKDAKECQGRKEDRHTNCFFANFAPSILCVEQEQYPAAGIESSCSTSAATLRFPHPRRQDDHRHAVPLQAPLQRIGGLVVQQRAVPGFALKDELAGEDDRSWENRGGRRGRAAPAHRRRRCRSPCSRSRESRAGGPDRRIFPASPPMCFRRRSTSSTPLKLPESTTPTEMKIMFLK